MSNLAPDIGTKLAKLLPRLASPHDGEVLATVEAIRRTLERAGFSLHDLADRLAEATPAPPANPSLSADQKEQFARANWLINNVKNDLSGKQAKFVETVIKLLSDGMSLTDKQAGWLTGLCDIHGYRS